MSQLSRAISLHLRAFPGEEGEQLRDELVQNGNSYLGAIGLSGGQAPTLSLVEAD
jgi:hypothetical protein